MTNPLIEFLFLDETGFNLENTFNYTWAPIGQDNCINTNYKSRNLTMICSITKNGVFSY